MSPVAAGIIIVISRRHPVITLPNPHCCCVVVFVVVFVMKKTSLVVVYCYLHHRAASSIAPRDRDRTLMTTTKMRTYADVMREFLIEGTVKLIRDVSENGRLAIGIVVYQLE